MSGEDREGVRTSRPCTIPKVIILTELDAVRLQTQHIKAHSHRISVRNRSIASDSVFVFDGSDTFLCVCESRSQMGDNIYMDMTSMSRNENQVHRTRNTPRPRKERGDGWYSR